MLMALCIVLASLATDADAASLQSSEQEMSAPEKRFWTHLIRTGYGIFRRVVGKREGESCLLNGLFLCVEPYSMSFAPLLF